MMIVPADVAHCLDLIKHSAPDLYFADLLLPDAYRSSVVVLHAFHVENTNIALVAMEPMAGEVRLQWWADVVAGQREQEAQGHPVARALLSVIRENELSVASFDAKLQAHIFDLYNDPMPDRTTLEGYLGEVYSMLFQNAALLAGAEPTTELADASGHSGVAFGLVGVLENLARHRSAHKIFVPEDLLVALGSSTEQFLSATERNDENIVAAIADLAEEHHLKAMQALGAIPSHMRPIFKPLGLVPLYLKRVRRNPSAVFEGLAPVPQWRRQWALWRF